jgi:putative transposase
MLQPKVIYKRHRYPPSVIAPAVWLYIRFPLSLRLVEELLLERGIVVSYGNPVLGEEVRSGLCWTFAAETAKRQ